VRLLPVRSLLRPARPAEEVWFGITFHGHAAKVGEVAHWIVWATFAYGLWRMRPWVPVAAAVYFLQVALAHLVWSVVSPAARHRHRPVQPPSSRSPPRSHPRPLRSKTLD
jgi:hypothetical protein